MKQKPTLIIIFTLLITLAFSGQSCSRGGSQEAKQAFQSMKLEYWTVFNSPEDYDELISAYKSRHPNISITVKKFRFDEYEEALLNALAEDRGPDIFSLHHTWLPSYRLKLLPLPSATTLARQVQTGSIKKEITTQLITTPSLSAVDLQNQFLSQVYKDVYLPQVVVEEGKTKLGNPAIYGLPIAFDTMVLYYNRDMLDNAGIAQPAETWSDFQSHVVKLAKFDSEGDILTAGAPIGTAYNVPRSVDILSVLMIQNGTVMIDEEDNEVMFHKTPSGLADRSNPPGITALDYYTSFASPNRRTYTWNEDQDDGFEAFLQGKAAYFFGYAYHRPQIEALAPKLNYGLANLPQIQRNDARYYANYWVESVSKKTQYPDAAWDFVQYASSNEGATMFVQSAYKPTARRDLKEFQLTDPEMEVFASQLLYSTAWYQGNDPASMETIMKALITDTVSGADTVTNLIKLAAQRVQQTL